VIVNLSLVPSISSTQIIEVCPFLKVVLPPTKSPVRISGPFVSNKIATFVDNSLLISNNGGMECIECGCCSYTCPAKRNMTQAFKKMKYLVSINKRK
jgi:Na+-translocating ferredoxin:NAD+ oxidoreductase RnfC subunit